MYRIVRFGNTTLIPQGYATISVAAGPASTFTTLPMARGGVWDSMGTEAARPQGQEITSTSRIFESTTQAVLETQERELRAMLGVVGMLWREWDSSGLWEWCIARCTVVGGQRVPGNYNYMDFPITWKMESMSWFGASAVDSIDPNPLTGDLLLLGVENVETYPVYYTFVNGSAQQLNVIFSITARGGAVTAITIANSTTGHTFVWAGTLAAGKTLVIDCGLQSVLNDGTPDYAGLTTPTDKEEWMILDPGANDISFSITEAGTESTIEVMFYPAEN
jgi:hypothetical protein